MAKTSKGMILNSQNKLQNDLQFVLIDIDDKDSISLIHSVDQNLIFADVVSKRTNWIKNSLDQLGLKVGCYLISDLRGQTNINVANLINGFSPIRQYGYQVGIIADINQLSNLDDLIKNQVYLINSGKSNQKQDALLQKNEIDDYSGKLSKGMSVSWQRDYTNVDVSIDHAGYVGMGQDTLLKGGKGFGYSTNGKDFNTVISPKGIIFRRADAERMWRLLRPNEITDINNVMYDRVKKEVESATAENPDALQKAQDAVNRADSAVANSKVNSDAIKAMRSAASDASSKADAANSTANKASSAAGKAQSTADSNAHKINSVSSTVTTVQTVLHATQIELSGKADKATVDDTNRRLNDTNAQVKIVAGEVSSKAEQTTVTNLSNTVNNIKGSIDWKTVTGLLDANTYKTTQRIFYRDAQAKNTPNAGWFYFKVDAGASDRITQTLTRDNATDTWTRVWNGSWSNWTKQATGNDIGNLQAQVTRQSTEINNNTNAINMKANRQDVDTIKHTVQEQQAQQRILANQIQSKVTSSDVRGILANGHYATQDYMQSIIDQTSRTLNANITEVQRNADNNHQDDINRMTNIQASIDGIQGVVKNKADQSTVTQLANTYQIKLNGTGLVNVPSTTAKFTKGIDNDSVAIADFDASTVKKGTRIDLEFDYSIGDKDPDCDFLVQTDADPWTIFGTDYNHATKGQTGHCSKIIVAPDCSKSKIKHITIRTNKWKGTLTIKNLTVTSGENVQTALNMLNDDMNLRVTKGDLISQINMEAGRTLIQSKKILMNADTVVMGPNTRAFIPSAAITNIDADKINTGVLNGIDIHQIETKKGRSIDISNGNITLKSKDPYEPRITFDYNGQFSKMFNARGDLECNGFSMFNFAPNDPQSLHPISFFQVVNNGGLGTGTAQLRFDHAMLDGHSWWANADGVTFGRTWDGINGSLNYVNIYAQSFDPHSQLSSKTRIEKLDQKEALGAIMEDHMYTYQYKSDVASGNTKRYASLIIDDVHDVAQYTEPDIFIADNKKCRDDGTQLAYAIAAIQYQQQEIEELKAELKKGKQHE